MVSFLKTPIDVFDIFFKRLCKESFKDLEFNSNWKFQTRAILSNKILKVFAKLHKSPFLIANIVKDVVSGLRQFLSTERPWKIINDGFYFILTNWICHWQIEFCSYYAFSLNQMSDIREFWKYWPLKDGFRLILQKFNRTAISRWMDQKTSNF